MTIPFNRIALDLPRELPDGQVVYDEILVKDILSEDYPKPKHLDLMFISVLADVYTWLRIPPREVWKTMTADEKRKALIEIFSRYCRLIELGMPSYFFRESFQLGEEHNVMDE